MVKDNGCLIKYSLDNILKKISGYTKSALKCKIFFYIKVIY